MLIAKADGPGALNESNEFNNARLAFIQIGADLTITGLSGPATAGAGSTITISDITSNQGAAPAPTSLTRFYLSTDFTLDATDVPLQTRSVPALAGGASHSAATSVTIPASTADGTYVLFAKAVAAGTVAESSAANNTRNFMIRIGPDLAVTAASAPAKAAAGSSIEVTETTQNIGTGAANASTTGFYLSTNSLLDASDLRIGSRTVPALAPGGSSARTTTLTLPAAGVGTWYLLVNADDDRTIAETQETNNTRALTLLIGPDLTVSSFSLPFTVTAGGTVAISDTVKNSGASDAGASVVRFYLSSNTVLDADDQLLGGRGVPALAAGATNNGTTPVVIPGGLTGLYYLFAVADATSVVVESSETNNTFVRLVQITR
jgi:subtilase family serine protease